MNQRLTDTGNAERLVNRHGDDMRYCPQMKKWYIWDGKRWKIDIEGRVVAMAKATATSYRDDARELDKATHQGTITALIKHANRSESLHSIQSMVKLAEYDSRIVINYDSFDKNPELLCVSNGVIDLTDNSYRKFDRWDNITRIANVSFVRGARSTLWEKFLTDIIPDPTTRSFIQRAVGYSVTGLTTEEVIFFLYGGGANGKTTFISTLLNMLGDYSEQASSNALMQDRSTGANNELYVLRGKRFVAATETGESKKLDEEEIKKLTGMDLISVNPKYMSQMVFLPVWKIWLSTNHEPIIHGEDDAIWRRIIKIPFTVQIKKPNVELKLRLLNNFEERSGILNWVLEGVRQWREKKLTLSEEIHKATRKYRKEQDVTGRFLKDKCRLGKSLMIEKGNLYRVYVSWCNEEKEKPKTKNMFGQALSKRGIVSQRNTNTRYWIGIDIKRTVDISLGGLRNE